MVVVKPVSSLSIRRVVNIYTIVVFLGFGIFLYFLAQERYSDFKDAHQATADKAVKVASREVKNIIENKRRGSDSGTMAGFSITKQPHWITSNIHARSHVLSLSCKLLTK